MFLKPPDGITERPYRVLTHSRLVRPRLGLDFYSHDILLVLVRDSDTENPSSYFDFHDEIENYARRINAINVKEFCAIPGNPPGRRIVGDIQVLPCISLDTDASLPEPIDLAFITLGITTSLRNLDEWL